MSHSIRLPAYGLIFGAAPLSLPPIGAVPLFEERSAAVAYAAIASNGKAVVTALPAAEAIVVHLQSAKANGGAIIIWNPVSLEMQGVLHQPLDQLLDELRAQLRSLTFPVHIIVGEDGVSPHLLSSPERRKAVAIYETEEELTAIALAIGLNGAVGACFNSAANLLKYFTAITASQNAVEWILRRPVLSEETSLNFAEETPFPEFLATLQSQAARESGAGQN